MLAKADTVGEKTGSIAEFPGADTCPPGIYIYSEVLKNPGKRGG